MTSRFRFFEIEPDPEKWRGRDHASLAKTRLSAPPKGDRTEKGAEKKTEP